ncbi:GH25 family lysozyme [Schleiferilactobacillus shenzhenensis]|uniref:Lysozyme n=1 Tax=Schleiferilactobacillus shenzhenensis LY-73 TaxID=1231336 RepID=U4TNM0_9LACO|nr:GH25 family lysozyme [Schleiferilactobacillus shenzhenensis]ERL65035.1 lysozyme [Schleiferilactobacillus shenzhenensis LY-73]
MHHSHRIVQKLGIALLLGLGVGVAVTTPAAEAAAFAQFADVASYQPDDVVFFKSLATNEVAGVVVKLTEGSADGDAYVNPKAGAQIKAAQASGLKVSLYHYARYNSADEARDEADFFADTADQFGLGKNTVVVDDVEDSSLADPYNDTVAFQSELAARGFNNQVTYSMASWFWNNKVPRNYPIWVANYGVDSPQVDNAAAWQYTNNYQGKNVDMSYDFTGIFTNSTNNSSGSSTNNNQPTPTVTKNAVAQIKYVPGYSVALWNGYGAARTFSGRKLPHNSRWKVVKQIQVNGHYWYNVGTNQWIDAQYTDHPNGFSNLS